MLFCMASLLQYSLSQHKDWFICWAYLITVTDSYVLSDTCRLSNHMQWYSITSVLGSKSYVHKHYQPLLFSNTGYLDRFQLPHSCHQFSTVCPWNVFFLTNQIDGRIIVTSAIKTISLRVIWYIVEESIFQRKIILSNVTNVVTFIKKWEL